MEESKYHGMEYPEFVEWAIMNGFEPDIAPSKYLLKPKSILTLVTSPGQWELLLLIAAKIEAEIDKRYRKPGRPPKVA